MIPLDYSVDLPWRTQPPYLSSSKMLWHNQKNWRNVLSENQPNKPSAVCCKVGLKWASWSLAKPALHSASSVTGCWVFSCFHVWEHRTLDLPGSDVSSSLSWCTMCIVEKECTWREIRKSDLWIFDFLTEITKTIDHKWNRLFPRDYLYPRTCGCCPSLNPWTPDFTKQSSRVLKISLWMTPSPDKFNLPDSTCLLFRRNPSEVFLNFFRTLTHNINITSMKLYCAWEF